MLKKNLITNYIINNSEKLKINSNDIKIGDVFLALQGIHQHGNDFLNESIKNGAKYCLTDKKINKQKNNKKILYVSNLISFLNKIAIKKRKLFKGVVIGITGSAGKTTLKETLSFFLIKKFKVSLSYKSYNNLLGVTISILNLNLQSKYAIFELGTNNFGEIKELVKLVLPSQVFITNIQPAHLENFSNKKNIAIEKSSIFNPKYNPNISTLTILNETKEENLLFRLGKKFKIKHINTVGTKKNNSYFIKKISKKKDRYKVDLINSNTKITFLTETNIIHRIINIVFCITFFNFNKLDTNIIFKNIRKLKPVVGRGLIYEKKINKFKMVFIDETYNANPNTMKQSIKYFDSMKKKGFHKILILGNMNELGDKSNLYHFDVLKFVEKYKFNLVILCGNFFELAVSKLIRPFNKYIIKKNDNEIIEYIKYNLHNNAMILAKCSNSTKVNKFGLKLIKIKEIR